MGHESVDSIHSDAIVIMALLVMLILLLTIFDLFQHSSHIPPWVLYGVLAQVAPFIGWILFFFPSSSNWARSFHEAFPLYRFIFFSFTQRSRLTSA